MCVFQKVSKIKSQKLAQPVLQLSAEEVQRMSSGVISISIRQYQLINRMLLISLHSHTGSVHDVTIHWPWRALNLPKQRLDTQGVALCCDYLFFAELKLRGSNLDLIGTIETIHSNPARGSPWRSTSGSLVSDSTALSGTNGP